MVISKEQERVACDLEVGGIRIIQVYQFCYFGSWITSSGCCGKETEYRIGKAKRAFNDMKSLLKNRKLSLQSMKRMVKAYIWSILLIGCETWTVNRKMEQKLEAAEMYMRGRVLIVSWKERVKNQREKREIC